MTALPIFAPKVLQAVVFDCNPSLAQPVIALAGRRRLPCKFSHGVAAGTVKTSFLSLLKK
jgi:hypothetical protein